MLNKLLAIFKPVAVFLMVTVLMVITPLVRAKGNFSKVVIRCSGLTSDIDVTDPALMEFFSFSVFPEAKIAEPDPSSLGSDCVITRYEQDSTSDFEAWDQLRYYPATSGTGGYIYYEGLLNGSSEYDQKWYLARPEAETAIQSLLAKDRAASNKSQLPPSLYLIVAVGLVFAAVAAIQHRSNHPKPKT